jgi:MYXO-CTERM domain-containing protein
MKHAQWSTTVRAGVLALSLLVLPLTLPTFAQIRETTPAPTPQVVETRHETDNRGLWGLLGLAGLAGLMGRRRHVEAVRSYDAPRERSTV